LTLRVNPVICTPLRGERARAKPARSFSVGGCSLPCVLSAEAEIGV